MFGVYLPDSAGKSVWPALSFRELGDQSIIGCGDRFVAESVLSGLASEGESEGEGGRKS